MSYLAVERTRQELHRLVSPRLEHYGSVPYRSVSEPFRGNTRSLVEDTSRTSGSVAARRSQGAGHWRRSAGLDTTFAVKNVASG